MIGPPDISGLAGVTCLEPEMRAGLPALHRCVTFNKEWPDFLSTSCKQFFNAGMFKHAVFK
jgi:hypothetical protein